MATKAAIAKAEDPHFKALDAVYTALKDLDDPGRKRVLASVYAILGISDGPSAIAPQRSPEGGNSPFTRTPIASNRPTSLIETMEEKKPGTNAQRIVVFAYHREKNEDLARFARDDLKAYFSKAKLAPPGNYDRDFSEAVKRGWVHEDGADSYLTTKGIEAVESSFEGERRYSQHTTKKKASKNKARTGRRRK